MRVLVIGDDTPVGRSLCEHFERRGREFSGIGKSDCRWKSERQAKKSLRRGATDFAVDTRLQAAADGGIRINDIDINRSLWLARASETLKIPCLHLSAARVFAGDAERKYLEDDPPDGKSSIARLLIRAEELVRENCGRHVILRTGPVFSGAGINVATHMLNQLRDGGALTLGRWHQGCPLPAEDVARVVSGMLDQFSCGVEAWGIYHYCSCDITNCHEFAEVLLAEASRHGEFSPDALQPEPEEEGAAAVSRELDCEKIRNTFAIKQQPWRGSVAGHVQRYCAEHSDTETAATAD